MTWNGVRKQHTVGVKHARYTTLLLDLDHTLLDSDASEILAFEHALGTSAGSLSPRTRWSQLADYEFSLPPKDELAAPAIRVVPEFWVVLPV